MATESVALRRSKAPSKKIILATIGIGVAAIFLIYSRLHRPASAVPWVKLAATADCDCPNVSTTSWRKATIDMCKEGERAILDEAKEGRFEIIVNDAGRMGGVGPFCDSGAAGPIAWPMRGGSPIAPTSLRVPACHYIGGTTQWVCP